MWLDCLGGLTVGAVVLSAHRLLSQIEGLPIAVIVFMGFANLAYGLYSLLVTTRQHRTIGLISALAIANMAWLLVCLAIALLWYDTITLVGLIIVIGEGIYVAALGCIEWLNRVALSRHKDAAT